MVIIDLVLFLVCLTLLVKSADYASRYASKVARTFHLSEFIVSFFVVAVISALPESTIAIISAINGIPQLGLGTLFGSNIADLALVFGLGALISNSGISVKSQILKKDFLYLGMLIFPVLLGLDGNYTRIEGVLLVVEGAVFFLTLSIESHMFRNRLKHIRERSFLKSALMLVISLGVLVAAANYTIKFGVSFAEGIGIAPILVGLVMVSIGTCLPELTFSIRAVKANHDQLALGDILGTVIIDATIVVGIMAIIRPFFFDPSIIYLTGITMFVAGLLSIIFISTGKTLTKREGLFLVMFYVVYLITEVILSRVI